MLRVMPLARPVNIVSEAALNAFIAVWATFICWVKFAVQVARPSCAARSCWSRPARIAPAFRADNA